MPAHATDTTSFRMPYAVLATIVAALIAMAGGWSTAARSDSDKEARIVKLESWKVEHEAKTAERLAELRGLNAHYEKTMAESFADQKARDEKLTESITALQIAFARIRP